MAKPKPATPGERPPRKSPTARKPRKPVRKVKLDVLPKR